MKKNFKKMFCIVSIVVVFLSSMLTVTAAPSSRSWNMYYTNSTSGNHTYESTTIADALQYTCNISSLSGSNGGKKMTVEVLYALPGQDRAVFTSVTGPVNIRSVYLNVDRTVNFTLSYVSNGGICASTVLASGENRH